ncbi:hypothetical protein HS048_30735 [Planomonospora sp. ID91781]|uniref:Uncharacterized protein n=2 Tax=Planomonospora parontospora TaxID=58119 RepID=A0AA37F2Z6_9ACTN|nr:MULTISPECIES: hypothetical protein [Planomonospora]MBG0825072.1 hypothetical protein [Planomonospora sp. ID91781]GGK53027.1 hypothetical protein GCM10010126_10720 [Planomonospora parontospora]GII06791.1 hypothetical protein Ppa06_05890 [Planomonospora parontospora subsp. parontospora]
MFSLLSSRRIAVTLAGAALISMTAACGGAANAEACTEAQSILTNATTSMSTAGTDPAKFNEATQKVADDFKALAAKTDGDLATAITGFADVWANIKIDTANPAGLATSIQDLTSKSQAFSTELAKACS